MNLQNLQKQFLILAYRLKQLLLAVHRCALVSVHERLELGIQKFRRFAVGRSPARPGDPKLGSTAFRIGRVQKKVIFSGVRFLEISFHQFTSAINLWI